MLKRTLYSFRHAISFLKLSNLLGLSSLLLSCRLFSGCLGSDVLSSLLASFGLLGCISLSVDLRSFLGSLDILMLIDLIDLVEGLDLLGSLRICLGFGGLLGSFGLRVSLGSISLGGVSLGSVSDGSGLRASLSGLSVVLLLLLGGLEGLASHGNLLIGCLQNFLSLSISLLGILNSLLMRFVVYDGTRFLARSFGRLITFSTILVGYLSGSTSSTCRGSRSGDGSGNGGGNRSGDGSRSGSGGLCSSLSGGGSRSGDGGGNRSGNGGSTFDDVLRRMELVLDSAERVHEELVHGLSGRIGASVSGRLGVDARVKPIRNEVSNLRNFAYLTALTLARRAAIAVAV